MGSLIFFGLMVYLGKQIKTSNGLQQRVEGVEEKRRRLAARAPVTYTWTLTKSWILNWERIGWSAERPALIWELIPFSLNLAN